MADAQSKSTFILTSNEDAIKNLLWHKNGILYENNILLIRVETEIRRHRGFILLKYKNKTSQVMGSLTSFTSNENGNTKLELSAKLYSTTIPANEEIIQNIAVECLQVFTYRPALSLNFLWKGLHQGLELQLPIALNSFIEPLIKTSKEFFTTWDSMKNCKEYSAAIPGKFVMTDSILREKLNSFGLYIIYEEMFSHLHQFTCAATFYSRPLSTAILIKLDCDFPIFMYVLKVKSKKGTISEEILKLAQLLF